MRYQKRLQRCTDLMRAAGLDALLLTKPANMFYLTGDGRLGPWGVRVEDTVVVGPEGPEVLTGYPRQLRGSV